METEEIREKNRQLQENKMDERKSIGIANVNRRIKAVYGNAYGVRMEKAVSGGVRVIIKFHPEKGEEENENSDDR